MPDTVYLHIGAFKTGTTYVQNVLWNNRDLLASEGMLFPGPTAWRDQAFAAMDVLGVTGNAARPKKTAGAWQRLLRTIEEWSGPTVLISTERLSVGDAGHVQRIVGDLAPAEVHVVLTARDLGRTIPASWQERLKNWNSWSWPEFIASISEPPPWRRQPAKGFWAQQDVVSILARWSAAVPKDRITVVTVPPAGTPPHVLLERFGSVIGSDPARWDAAVDRRNESLGAAEAELLRRVNPDLRKRVPWPVYDRHIKHGLASEVLVKRAGQRKIELPVEHFDWVMQRSQQTVDGIRWAGYRVVGDLADLLPASPPRDRDVPPPDEVSDVELLAVAEEAIVALVERLAEQDRGGRSRPSRRQSAASGARAKDPGTAGLRRIGASVKTRLTGR